MSKFLILGPTFDGRLKTSPNYRGLERIDAPSSIKDEAKNQLLQNAIADLVEIIDYSKGGAYILDFDKANHIAKVFTYCSDESYQVIEVINVDEKFKFNGKFLGYDLIWKEEGNDSLIIMYLDIEMKWENNEPAKTEWLEYLRSKYSHMLNENILFNTLEDCMNYSKEVFEYSPAKPKGEIFGLQEISIYKG
jgi:hypothetical protein